MFPEYAYSAFQTNLDSLNTTTSVTIDYIFKEVKIRKDSAKKIINNATSHWTQKH